MLLKLEPTGPWSERIYSALRRAILAGELSPGARVPASRRLAADLGVARNTVVGAYERLIAEGFLRGHGAAGTLVCDVSPRGLARAPRSAKRPAPPRLGAEGRRIAKDPHLYHPAARRPGPRRRFDFRYNASVADATSRREWGRLARRVLARHENAPPDYEFQEGPGALEQSLVRYLASTRGVDCTPEQVVLVPNPQAGLALAARLFVDPGDAVALEDPHYLGARSTLRGRGARLLPVPVDDSGLRPDRLPERRDIRFVYATASHQWPTGATLPVGRRLALLEWARRRRAYVVENDHNSEHLYGGTPVQSMQGLDPHDRVIYLATFHRLFRPPPGIAFAVVPQALTETFRGAANHHGLHPSRLIRDTLERFLEEGCLERLVRRASRRMRARRVRLQTALDALGRHDLDVRASSGGTHLYVRLRGWSRPEVAALVARAATREVEVHDDSPFWLQPPRDPGLLVGFAEIAEDRIEEGVARLGEAMSEARGS
ncbi:MAG: PLP-dependent aminotransferase family protein [bacterium]